MTGGIESTRNGLLRPLGMAVAIISLLAVALLGFYLAVSHKIAWPQDASLSHSKPNEYRDRGFAYLIEHAVSESGELPLKVYFGWSQYVWIVLYASANGGTRIAMLEHSLSGDRSKIRTFKLSSGEASAFLEDFDKAALGYHVTSVGGYDGREISFERQRNGVTLSYSGNASFSSQDAEMARVVDALVMAHGGYTYLDERSWGIVGR